MAYNNVGMPVKLFDYSLWPADGGDCLQDIAAFVQKVDAGIVVQDSATTWRRALLPCCRTGTGQTVSARTLQAVQTSHSWGHRAAQILAAIEQIEQERRDAHPAR